MSELIAVHGTASERWLSAFMKPNDGTGSDANPNPGAGEPNSSSSVR